MNDLQTFDWTTVSLRRDLAWIEYGGIPVRTGQAYICRILHMKMTLKLKINILRVHLGLYIYLLKTSTGLPISWDYPFDPPAKRHHGWLHSTGKRVDVFRNLTALSRVRDWRHLSSSKSTRLNLISQLSQVIEKKKISNLQLSIISYFNYIMFFQAQLDGIYENYKIGTTLSLPS
jgi:hypothetical protein